MTVRALISDKSSPSAAEILRARGIETDERFDLSPTQLADAIGAYDVLLVRSATKVTEALLEKAERLRVVARAGVGVDNVDVAAATKRGVLVMNTPGGNSVTTAEHAVAMMMALARRIPQADASTKRGEWAKSRFTGMELEGKTLGIAGCGAIGSLVASRAAGLGMRVLGYDPYITAERLARAGVERVEQDELFERSDVLTLHVPLTDATRKMVDAQALARAPKGMLLVNCARGGLVDEEALLSALESGHVGGAALDVYETEPLTASPFFARDDVICTPHLGASTQEAQDKVARQAAIQAADYVLEGAVTNALNAPATTREEALHGGPWIRLSRDLGLLLGQCVKSAAVEFEATFTGEASRYAPAATAAALAGFLSATVERVNVVNAFEAAKERGLEASHKTREEGRARASLRVRTERRERTAAGVLSAVGEGRVVEMDGVEMETPLTGHMLYLENEDRPGFVGALGTTLGQAGVNVATVALGREKRGGAAATLVGLDDLLGGDILEAVRDLEWVKRATTLRFSDVEETGGGGGGEGA